MKYGTNTPFLAKLARKRKLRRRRRIFLLSLTLTAIAVLYIVSFGLPGSRKESIDSNTQANAGTDAAQQTGANGVASNSSGTAQKAVKDINSLKQSLEAYIKQFKGTYGIYYTSLVSNESFGIHEREEYDAASTVKVPLNLYLYKRIREGKVNPDGTMTYLEDDYEGGTGSIRYERVGTQYTVRELSRRSIEVSDNVATNILLRLLGRDNLKDYMRSLGGTVVKDDANVSCPRDMAIYLKEMQSFQKRNRVLGDELMEFMLHTEFNDRIPALLSKSVKVAHKVGNQVQAVHDVGIVFAKRPYIISVMSKNVKESESNNVIANISKKIYDYVESKKS